MGRGFGISSFVCFGGTFTFLDEEGRGREYTIATGARSRRLRRIGVSAYRVVARRIAPTFRRKSTANAKGLYGLKKDCWDCNDDQRMTATFAELAGVKWQRKKSLLELLL